MKHIISLFVAIGLLCSCESMNDLHRPYLEQGEDIYIGRVENVVCQPGYNRAKLTFTYNDVRAGKVMLQWRQTSRTFDLPEGSLGKPVELVVEDLEADTYSIKIILLSKDEANKSVPVETQVTTFGEAYKKSLLNRKVKSAVYYQELGKIIIDWIVVPNAVCTMFEYKNNKGTLVTLELDNTVSSTTLEDVGSLEGMNYYTVYLASDDAFESLSTEKAQVSPEIKSLSEEKELDKSLFKRWNPEAFPYPGDYNGAWNIERLWNNTTAFNGYAAVKADYFCFDMGVIAKLTKMVFHQRSDASCQYLYCHAHPKVFKVYGSLTGEGLTADDSSWLYIGEFVSPDPGHPTGTQFCCNGYVEQDFKRCVTDGESFDVSADAPMFRYYRFKVVEKWATANASTDIQLTELDLYGRTY